MRILRGVVIVLRAPGNVLTFYRQEKDKVRSLQFKLINDKDEVVEKLTKRTFSEMGVELIMIHLLLQYLHGKN